MSRGVGEIEIVAGGPDSVAVLAALVTMLGDVWFIFILLGILYWFGTALPGPLSLPRKRAAFVIALAFGGLALTTTLKELFRLPRPQGAGEPAGAGLVPETVFPLYAQIGSATGYGFPSGHAVSAIVVYGGLALLVGRRREYLVAAALCVLIPASRIVLGVHYLADIAIGATFGAAYLGVTYWLCDRGSNPGRAFMLALVIALGGAAIGYTADTMIALGGALGARMAWGIVGGAVSHEAATITVGAATAAVGAVFGALFAVLYAVDPAPYVDFLGMFVVVWGVLSAPLAGGWIVRRYRPT